jgi:hypothetical protein
MAKWFGPRECACDCIIKCGCGDDPILPSMSFIGTPTIRIVVSGMPASYAWIDRINRISFNERNQWDLVGLNGINGTYFIELPKVNGFCIDKTANESFSSPVTYTQNRIRENSPIGDICNINFTETTTASRTASVSGSSVGGSLSFSIAASLSDFYEIRGTVLFECPSYDTADAIGNNTINGGFTTNKTWPYSSGEIRIIRRAISTATCGDPQEDASGEVFAVVGTIVAEMLDL